MEQINQVTIKSMLPREWCIWIHQDKDNWKLSGFKNLYTISSTEDFWQLYNNWDKLGGINQKHYFLMQKNIGPIWEDPEHVQGGAWTFRAKRGHAN